MNKGVGTVCVIDIRGGAMVPRRRKPVTVVMSTEWYQATQHAPGGGYYCSIGAVMTQNSRDEEFLCSTRRMWNGTAMTLISQDRPVLSISVGLVLAPD
jgi:hypothetical protein